MSNETDRRLMFALDSLKEANTHDKYAAMYDATSPYRNDAIIGPTMTDEEVRAGQQYVVDIHVCARLLIEEVEKRIAQANRPLWKKILHK